MTKSFPVIAAVSGAIVAGYLQIAQPNLLVTVAFILIAGIGLGAMWPDKSWVWGIILGLGIPAAYAITSVLGIPVDESTRPNIVIAFVAILPAIAGTTSGVALRFANKKGAL
jgi:hypothetical protein